MDAETLRDLRATLLDKEECLTFVAWAVDRFVEEEQATATDPSYAEWLVAYGEIAKVHAQQTVHLIHRYAESPIEKQFVTSLLFNFIRVGSVFFMSEPGGDATTERPTILRAYGEMSAIYQAYKDQRGGKDTLTGFDDHVAGLVAQRRLHPEQAEILKTYVLLYHFLDPRERFHITLQARFPGIRVNGRSIRTDVYIWVPADEAFNVIVECDGFDYHSDREAFARDRQRDRALKAHGYDVLRYAGTEIYRNPVQASSDLFDYLQSRLPDE